MKILVVDDDADIRRIVCVSLSRLGGMEVIEASSGADGVRKAEEECPDAILLDVMMPSMDGPATLAALRSTPATAGIPVVFLTATVLESEVARFKAMGAVDVLTKPFDPASLVAEVGRMLHRG